MSNADHRQMEGHRKRLRDKFLQSGLEGFHDYEVVELLLTLATPRKDCKAAAKAALARFKNLPAVLEASAEELSEVHGIGPRNLLGLKLIKAVADRYLRQRLEHTEALNNSRDLFNYLFHLIGNKTREHFVGIFLDAKNRVLASETLFRGTLTASSVYPREVVAAALKHHAAALILAHNHPSGVAEPSAEDIALTRQLVFACRPMGVTIHEHLVIGGNRYYSFADQGIMARLGREYESKIKA